MHNTKPSSLPQLVESLLKNHDTKDVDVGVIWQALRNALAPKAMIDNLAEALRVPAQDIERDLAGLGFSDIVALARLNARESETQTKGDESAVTPCTDPSVLCPFPHLFRVSAAPDFTEPIPLPKAEKEAFDDLVKAVAANSASDEFVKLYRHNVPGYFDAFMASDGKRIDRFLAERFAGGRPRYLVTTGIGANEQFTHFPGSINNENPDRRVTWLRVNSTSKLTRLPEDATVDNTLFMEFSRSGVTEETVKIHEYTPRAAHRMVFANQGPLREIGERDGDLVLPLPDQVSGRFGRNTAPILLAPMYVAGMDVASFWKAIQVAIDTFDLADPDSLPMVMAKFMYLSQQGGPRNLIYLGCNDAQLGYLADEFVQFWNEGVNKGGNDLIVSSFFGLPRDSHMNIEGILGNRDTKMGVFLIRTQMRAEPSHPLLLGTIDAINPEHDGLRLGDEEVILAFANYERFAELMPTVLIEVPGAPRLELAAVLGQLLTDLTYLYSRLKNIDPGSNPEVKAVRDRSEHLLAEVAGRVRNGQPIDQAIHE